MWLKLGRLRVRVTFLFTAFLALVLQGTARETLAAALCAALLHECAHALCLLRFGRGEITLSLLPGGARLEGDALAVLSYRQAFFTALAGPACNFLLCAAAAAVLRRRPTAAALAFFRVNLALGCGNLLPLSFLDGGAALAALLSLRAKKVPPSLRASDLLLTVLLACFSAGLLVFHIRAEFLLAFTGYCILYQLLRR